MVNRKELLDWILGLDDDDQIGIGEGENLSLFGSKGYDPDNELKSMNWFEIGGMPLEEDFDYEKQERIDHDTGRD